MADSESTVRITIEVDDSAVDTAISSISELQDTTATVTIEADTSDLDQAVIPFDELDGKTVTPTVDAQETQSGKEVTTAIKTIAAIDVIRFAIDIVGTALDFVKAWASFGVGPILDAEAGMARFGAQTGVTGDALAQMDDMIRNIFFDDLGQSVDEVTNVAIAAQQLHLPVEEATRAALTFTHTFSDQSSITAITTMGTLLQTNMVDTMQHAADLITVFFQQGGNKGGDALSTINSYAQSWKDMGLTLPQALSAITSLTTGGVDSAGDAARMIQSLDDALTAAAANPTGAQAKMLDLLNLENPKDAGEAMGAEFLNAFADAITNAPSDVQDAATGLLMGKGGKKFTGAVEGLNTELSPYQAYIDAAAKAAEEIDNTLSGAWDDFTKELQGTVSDFLSSEAIDIPGKIAALKTGLQDALAVLQGGGDLEEALTVGLKPIGWDDEFQKLEAVFGNFVISLLDIVAGIQELGGHTEAAAATRAEQTRLAQQQLAFNLKIANPDEIATDIQNAVDRGVTPGGITDAIGTAVSELVSKGALDQAQALVNQFATQKQAVVSSYDLFGNQADKMTIPITPEMTDADIQAATDAAQAKLLAKGGLGWTTSVEIDDVTVDPDAVQAMQDEINAAALQTKALGNQQTPTSTVNATSTTSTPGLISPETLALQSTEAEKATAKLNDFSSGVTASKDATVEASTATADLTAKTTSAVTATYDHGRVLQVATNAVEVSTQAMDLQALASSDLGKDLYSALVQMQALSDSTHDFAANAALANQTMRDAASAASSAGSSGDTTAHPGKKASGGTFSGLSWVGEEGPELISTDTSLAVLNSRTSAAIMAALSGAAGRGSTTNYGGNKNVNLTQINNVQSMAQADALGYRTAETIRGV